MPSPLIIKWIASALLMAALSALLYSGYSHIKSIGYADAEAKYKPVIEKYELDLSTKLAKIEANSSLLVANDAKNATMLANGIGGILKSIKDQPLTVIKDGKCIPTKTFLEAFDAINKRTNESIKK